jgi:hypothetical protein
MLVTDQFVFLHVPKAGGTFVQTVLGEHLPVVDLDSILPAPAWTHASFRDLPPELQALPAFCVIRNPWDWYVSWFHYEMMRGPRRRLGSGPDPRGKRAAWVQALRLGEADFKEAVTRACTTDFYPPLASVMGEQGLDFYSALVQDIVGDAFDRPNFTVLRFERLRKELLRYLRLHMQPSRDLVRAIREEPKKLASRHGGYRKYYDGELRQLVGDKTAWLCERFGYSFDGAPATGTQAS